MKNNLQPPIEPGALTFSTVVSFLIIIAGLGLMVSKLFGQPYLIEGVMFVVLGILAVKVSSFTMNLALVIDKFTLMVDNLTENRNNQQHFTGESDFIKDVLKQQTGSMKPLRIDFDLNASKEELEHMKNHFPGLQDILDQMNPLKNIPYEDMDIPELERAMDKANQKEDFEKAIKIRDIIEKRKNK